MNKKNRKLTKKNKMTNVIINIVILFGIIIIIYPFVSQTYYNILSNRSIKEFDNDVKKIDLYEVRNRIELAKAYNDSLNNIIVTDPYVKEKIKKGKAEYAKMLEVHEKIGHVSIPKINQELPIYAGTTEEVLQKGVGHMQGTSLPVGGSSTHSVLTAHSGIPNNRLFTDLKKMNVGDHFYVTNIKETLAYEVENITIIRPSDFNNLMIFQGKDYVTLLTCTPYMINTHRLLVRGHRIPYDNTKKTEKKKFMNNGIFRIGIVTAMLIGILVFLLKNKKVIGK